MPRERPILFSGPMVRAILAGTKTQTRRIVKPQPDKTWDDGRPWWNVGGLNGLPKCPYGQPGELLWVRESLHQEFTTADRDTPDGCLAVYSADGDVAMKGGRPGWYEWSRQTLPSIHMPRWASRITLEITDVRVQRVQEITKEDAIAEGIESKGVGPDGKPRWNVYGMELLGQVTSDPAWSFERLWLSIHGSSSWKWNPYVWAITFRRVNTDGK